jgi:hypothetical protein
MLRAVSSALGRGAALATVLALAGQTALSELSAGQDGTSVAEAATTPRKINAPMFNGEVKIPEMAVFWFGRVTPTTNFADVRVGYNSSSVVFRVAVYDRRLFYDPNPTGANLTRYDAVSLSMRVPGANGGAQTFRFVNQLSPGDQRANRQAAFKWSPSGWVAATTPFSTIAEWRGNSMNDNVDDRGWVATFTIPFSSVGLSAAPANGSNWHLGVRVHDRDAASGPTMADQVWPEGMANNNAATWGLLGFGLPPTGAGNGNVTSTVLLRKGLNGVAVRDGSVGGGTSCGDRLSETEFFQKWGSLNYDTRGDFNIQNQSDIAD